MKLKTCPKTQEKYSLSFESLECPVNIDEKDTAQRMTYVAALDGSSSSDDGSLQWVDIWKSGWTKEGRVWCSEVDELPAPLRGMR